MAIRATKPTKLSPVFEQENLKRLKKCSDAIAHAQDVIGQSKRQLENLQELLDSLSRRKNR